MNFSWGQKVAALGGQEGAAKWQDFDFWPLVTKKTCLYPPVTWGQEGTAKGQEGCAQRGQKIETPSFSLNEGAHCALRILPAPHCGAFLSPSATIF